VIVRAGAARFIGGSLTSAQKENAEIGTAEMLK
jgi:hypothetical protein